MQVSRIPETRESSHSIFRIVQRPQKSKSKGFCVVSASSSANERQFVACSTLSIGVDMSSRIYPTGAHAAREISQHPAVIISPGVPFVAQLTSRPWEV
jgi:hypothetical protein